MKLHLHFVVRMQEVARYCFMYGLHHWMNQTGAQMKTGAQLGTVQAISLRGQC